MIIIRLLLGFLFTVSFTAAAPRELLITKLPGFNGTLPSKHYAGYVSIDGNPGKKNLFYYFIASERNPSKDPVVLWLNGGPGCSSFDGFIYEHGPLIFQAGNATGSLPTLHLNPFSWSKLDSPCGVGLSYSDDSRNYVTGDLQTASDSHAFLLKWFELYPEFLPNPFYISGESYAGIYVTTLVSEVIKGINLGENPLINLKGYIVGNGATNDIYDGDAARLPFAVGMGLISRDIFEDCQATCEGIFDDPPNKICEKNVARYLQAVAHLNFYNVLKPCYRYPKANNNSGNTGTLLSSHQLGVTQKPPAVRKRMSAQASRLWSAASDGACGSDVFHIPCINDDVANAWLNDEAVRRAIHAAPVSVAGRWSICACRVMLHYSKNAGKIIPYHKNLTSQGYRALLYSGDHDLAVPFTGTQAWTRSLGYKIIQEWRPWISNDQVAGHLQGYDHNLTFLTIKGAGHMVPQYKPREALDFYSRWLDGKPT